MDESSQTVRIYLDNSVLNRPFDDQKQGRIWLETLSLSLVLSMVENKEAEMIISPIHILENDACPESLRKSWVNRFLQLAAVQARLDENVRRRARELEAIGLRAIDALHLGSAEMAGAKYFLTCDDRLIKRYKGSMMVMNPQQFVSMEG